MVVYYQDENVCIVSRDTPGSIPVYTEVGYSFSPSRSVNVCIEGLKSFNQLVEEGVMKEKNRDLRTEKIDKDHYNKIYFRAPYKRADLSSNFESLIEQLYGEKRWSMNRVGLVTINVDPEHTYVFNSDANTMIWDDEAIQMGKNLLASSRQLLSEYLKRPSYEHEIVVKTPVIPPEWFSSCIIPGPTYKMDKMIFNYAPNPAGGEMIPTERQNTSPPPPPPVAPTGFYRAPKKPRVIAEAAPAVPAAPATISRSGRASKPPVRLGGGTRRRRTSRYLRKTRRNRR